MTSPARKRRPRPSAEPSHRKRGAVKEYRVEAPPPPDENPAAAQQILTWLARLARRR